MAAIQIQAKEVHRTEAREAMGSSGCPVGMIGWGTWCEWSSRFPNSLGVCRVT